MVGMAVETVNDEKPSWASYFLWLVIGVGLIYSVLGIMTIGLFILPFVLAALLAMLKWGGNRKSSVGLISGQGLPLLFLAYLNRNGPGTVCSQSGNGGQACREEYSPWPFVILGVFLVLLGVQMFFKFRAGSAVPLRRKAFMGLTLVLGVLAFGLIAAPSTRNSVNTEAGRAEHTFNAMLLAVSKQEPTPVSWLTPVHAGMATYADGSKASLWVPRTSPQGNRSNCFYVDKPRKGGASGFYESACLMPKASAIMERQGSVVVGFVSMARARQVTVSVLGRAYVVPITNGYFLVPGVLSLDPSAKFTITYTEPGQATCTVRDILAPGVSPGGECVIA